MTMIDRRWPEDPDGEIAITLRFFRALQEGCEERDALRREVERLRKLNEALEADRKTWAPGLLGRAVELEKRAEAAEAERDALRRKLDAVVPLLRAAVSVDQSWWCCAECREGYEGDAGGLARAIDTLPDDVRALAEGGDDG